jgi:hypothetical protein
MAEQPIQIEVEKYLGGMDYPAHRDELVDAARRNNAPKEVIDALEGLPSRGFDSPPAVSEALAGQ